MKNKYYIIYINKYIYHNFNIEYKFFLLILK